MLTSEDKEFGRELISKLLKKAETETPPRFDSYNDEIKWNAQQRHKIVSYKRILESFND